MAIQSKLNECLEVTLLNNKVKKLVVKYSLKYFFARCKYFDKEIKI